MNEKMKLTDSLEFSDGKLIYSNHSSGKLVGVVEMNGYDFFGNCIFKRTKTNNITLPGSIFILEQMFKIKSPKRFLHDTAATGFGSFTSSWTEPANVNDESVFGFMCGNSGETEAGVKVTAVNKTCITNGTQQTFIPFQVSTSTDTQPAGYYMKTSSGSTNYYFAKAFDETPAINVKYSDGTDVNASSIDSTKDIVRYTSVKLSISGTDFRKYFDMNPTATKVIDQIGLIAGTYNNTTYTCNDVKLITMLNFNGKDAIDFSKTESVNFIYKVYSM